MFRSETKLFLLGMDGVPHSLLCRLIEENHLPTLGNLVRTGCLRKTQSVLPPVSSVAWSSLTTGRNPGGHGLFGFIDRTPNPLQVFLPTSKDLRAKRVWEILGEQGKSSLVMNLPATYPPTPLNGMMVSGFEAPALEKATYPASLAGELSRLGYIIDIDPTRARKDKDYLLRALYEMLEARKKALFHLLKAQEWDFVLCHLMGTDRLHHFLWREWEENHPVWAPRFLEYYRALDKVVGEILAALPSSMVFMAASDHGFCSARQEVQLNRWLQQVGLLKMAGGKDIGNIAPESRAYSMIPGRFYVNLQGREATGTVPPTEYERVRLDLKGELRELKDPETGEQVITDIFMREEAYSGNCLETAPDLVALAKDGYELKADFGPGPLFAPSWLSGMHTYDNAFWLTVGRDISPQADSLLDIAPTILQIFGVKDDSLDRPGCLA